MITISSLAGLHGICGLVDYCASKFIYHISILFTISRLSAGTTSLIDRNLKFILLLQNNSWPRIGGSYFRRVMLVMILISNLVPAHIDLHNL